MNKAELTAALAMRTQISKADTGRAIKARFDDEGINPGQVKKGLVRPAAVGLRTLGAHGQGRGQLGFVHRVSL